MYIYISTRLKRLAYKCLEIENESVCKSLLHHNFRTCLIVKHPSSFNTGEF